MKQYRKLIGSLLVVLLFGSLLACRGLETRVEDKRVRLEQRLQAFLVARKAADIMEMQKFYKNPGQARVGSVVYKESEIVSTEITEDGQKAVTKLKNTIQAMGFSFDKVPQTLHWSWYEEDWFLVIPANSTHPFAKTDKKKPLNSDEPQK